MGSTGAQVRAPHALPGAGRGLTLRMVAQYCGSMLGSSPSICFSRSHTASTVMALSDPAPGAGPGPWNTRRTRVNGRPKRLH